LRLFSWNVNGIRACARKGFAAWLAEESPDVLLLQEVKAKPEQVPEGIADGYNSYWFPAEKPGYSGTSILSKAKPERVQRGMAAKRFDDEGRVITALYPEFTLVNVYAPQGSRDQSKIPFKLDFYRVLLDYLAGIDGPIVLGGDFNVAREARDLARPNENVNNTMFTPAERKAIHNVVLAGFADSFRELHGEGGAYTWWPYYGNVRERNVGWRIDYFFTKGVAAREAFMMRDVPGSDHCPIGLRL
jgi:exodeoxyribonuclease-3